MLLSQRLKIQKYLSQAKKAIKQGDTVHAIEIYHSILQLHPQHPIARKGLSKLQNGISHSQNQTIQTKITDPPQNQINALLHLYHSGKRIEVEKTCRELLKTYSQSLSIINLLGATLHMQGKLQEAVGFYEKAIQIKPDYVEAYINRGVALKELKQLERAIESYEKAIQIKPDYVEAYNNRGVVLKELGLLEKAIESYETAIQIKPDYVEAYINRGVALKELKQLEKAIESYEKAIQIKPDYAEAYSNRGVALQKLKQLEKAIDSYEKAIQIKPNYAEAYGNLGNALSELGQLEKAIESYDKVIQIRPNYAEAYINRGVALQKLMHLEEAIESYEKAIQIKPNSAEAHSNRGNALKDLKQMDRALESYNHAVALNPNIDFISGAFLYTKMHLCLWDDFEKDIILLIKKIKTGKKASTPFPMLALIDDPEIQRKTAEIYINGKYPQTHILLKNIACYPNHKKIKIGYFSADFHNHATMHLMAELFECHDKTKFEIIAFSFGPEHKDEWRKRAFLSFDQFIDVRLRTDRDIAFLAKEMEVDIAVDLKGFTKYSRPGIFAEGCASIQVNYLGYPGTMAAEFMDYLIADRVLIPTAQQQHYSEKIVYLPNSYQVNVSKRKVSKTLLTRHEHGLPGAGFVFCCFNNNYKITPSIFSGWIRILKAVKDSVLWLFEVNSSASNNLRKEAIKSGINGDRLIFAKRMSVEDHLNRIQLADLFIDTLPYNAHTTTSDALRMGLPVITCIGNSFASRVAASLLNAVKLPELITTSQEQYEALAINLAMHPETLRIIKDKLVANLASAPLYDTPLFTRHLESAYLKMYDRCQHGLDPDHIFIEN